MNGGGGGSGWGLGTGNWGLGTGVWELGTGGGGCVNGNAEDKHATGKGQKSAL